MMLAMVVQDIKHKKIENILNITDNAVYCNMFSEQVKIYKDRINCFFIPLDSLVKFYKRNKIFYHV